MIKVKKGLCRVFAE